MEVYRGEGRFDVFNSVVLDKEKNITLKDVLEKFTAEIESKKYSQEDIDDFVFICQGNLLHKNAFFLLQ